MQGLERVSKISGEAILIFAELRLCSDGSASDTLEKCFANVAAAAPDPHPRSSAESNLSVNSVSAFPFSGKLESYETLTRHDLLRGMTESETRGWLDRLGGIAHIPSMRIQDR